MPFTLPAPTTNVNGWAPIWANFTTIAAFLNALNVSVIKTIQPGTITIVAGVATNTFTLGTAVTVAKAFIVFGGFTVNAASNDTDMPYVVLTNATTVTATRNSAGGNITTVAFTVVEFN